VSYSQFVFRTPLDLIFVHKLYLISIYNVDLELQTPKTEFPELKSYRTSQEIRNVSATEINLLMLLRVKFLCSLLEGIRSKQTLYEQNTEILAVKQGP
jgi:hypothetical protein